MVHFVSQFNAIITASLALYIFFANESIRSMGWVERVYGYDGSVGLVQGLAAGYFLWDLMVSTIHLEALGPGSLVHAVCALSISAFGFRPYLNYYGLCQILFEISNPFMNTHWFLDKLDMTGSTLQLVNGGLLLTTFFFTRLVWGTYTTVWMYKDIWKALHHNNRETAAIGTLESVKRGEMSEMLRFVGDRGRQGMSVYLAAGFVIGNAVLTGLNVYWFSMMIESVRKRFSHGRHDHGTLERWFLGHDQDKKAKAQAGAKEETNGHAVKSNDANGHLENETKKRL